MFAPTYQDQIERSGDLRRIAALPRRSKAPEGTDQLTSVLRTPEGAQTLRPVQAQALAELYLRRGLLGPIRVGGGKTLISYLAPRMVNSHRPLLLVPAKLREKTRHDFRDLSKHWLTTVEPEVFSYEMLGLPQYAGKLNELAPDLIIADECFVEGTLVDTPSGPRPIEDLAVGDQVLNAVGIGHVRGTIQRKTEQIIQIRTDAGIIQCTSEHPFMTNRGWTLAKDLDVTHRLMKQCTARRLTSVHEGVRGMLENLRGYEGQASFLYLQLCSEMEMSSEELARIQEEIIFNIVQELESFLRETRGRRLQRSVVQEDEREQPHERPKHSIQGFGEAQKHGAQTQGSWGERDRTDESGESVDRATAWSDLELSRENRDEARIRIPHLLQSRPSVSRREVGHRDRWFESSGTIETAARQEERGATGFVRVECVEVLEQRGTEQSRGYSVYNLDVSGHPSYSVNGVLVHNCQRIKNPKAAVTRRVGRYMDAHPSTMFVALSGTITKRSLRDFAHIAEWCLGRGAPVPLDRLELERWCRCLDEKNQWLDARVAPGALLELEPEAVHPSGFGQVEAARRIYQHRLEDTPGVVITHGQGVSSSLTLSPWGHGVKMPGALKAAFRRLGDLWELPDGQPLVRAVDVWRHARELSQGFFYRWDPEPPMEWLEARREWAAFVRNILSFSKTLDSEAQVMENYQNSAEYRAWAEVKGSYFPTTTAEWITTEYVERATDWAQKAGIVWVGDIAVAQALEKIGLDYYGSMGLNRQGRRIEDARGGIAASIAANSEGRNLQHYHRNLILSPPTTGDQWEQLMGRTHRDGQEADEVTFEVLLDSQQSRDALEQAISDARYQQAILGSPQKLLLADRTEREKK